MPDTTTMKKAKRSQFMAFLNTTPASETATWSRMGKGITGQTVAYNPKVTTETYIDEDSATTNVDSYQPNIPTPQTVYVGESCFAFVDGLRRKRAVGEEALTQILLVNAYQEAVSGAYPAERCACAIQIDDFGGEAGGNLAINYTINLSGDPVQGTFAPATRTFTEAEPTA